MDCRVVSSSSSSSSTSFSQTTTTAVPVVTSIVQQNLPSNLAHQTQTDSLSGRVAKTISTSSTGQSNPNDKDENLWSVKFGKLKDQDIASKLFEKDLVMVKAYWVSQYCPEKMFVKLNSVYSTIKKENTACTFDKLILLHLLFKNTLKNKNINLIKKIIIKIRRSNAVGCSKTFLENQLKENKKEQPTKDFVLNALQKELELLLHWQWHDKSDSDLLYKIIRALDVRATFLNKNSGMCIQPYEISILLLVSQLTAIISSPKEVKKALKNAIENAKNSIAGKQLQPLNPLMRPSSPSQGTKKRKTSNPGLTAIKEPRTQPNSINPNKKLRIADKHKYQKRALLKCFHEPDLWYKPPRLSCLLEYLWGPAAININESNMAQVIAKLIDQPIDYCPRSYKAFIYLFFLQLELEGMGEIESCANIEKKMIFLLPDFALLPTEVGELIRYASLIDTPKSQLQLGDNFRRIIAQNFMKPIHNSDKPWRSTQQRLRDTIALCKQIEDTPKMICRILQLTSVSKQGGAAIKFWAKKLNKRCQEWLLQLKSGSEVKLPLLYHNSKKTNNQVVPRQFLAGELKETNQDVLAGVFVSTQIEDPYLAPGFSFPQDVLYTNTFLNYVPQASSPYSAVWLGFKSGIPISLSDGRNVLLAHNLSTVISMDGEIGRQRNELPPSLAHVAIMEFSEAKLFEYCLNSNSPIHLSRRNTEETSINYYNKYMSQPIAKTIHLAANPIAKAIFEHYGIFDYLQLDPAIKFTQNQQNKLASIQTLRDYLGYMPHNYQEARKMSKAGYFTGGVPLRDGVNEQSTSSMQCLYDSRNERMQKIATAFPELPAIKTPALHHTWLDIINQPEIFGRVVGYHPHMIINFTSVQTLLFEKTLIAREKIAHIDSSFLSRLLNLDPEASESHEMAKRILLNTTVLTIIHKAKVGPDSTIGSYILCPLTLDGIELAIALNMNSFDQHGGLDERLYPNDPWLATYLYLALSQEEKTLLLNRVLGRGRTSPSNERVDLVHALIDEIAKAIEKRYFASNDSERDVLPKLSNSPLTAILKGRSRDAILADFQNRGLLLTTSASCSFLPKFSDNLFKKIRLNKKSQIKINFHRSNFSEALNAGKDKNTALWFDPVNHMQKSRKIDLQTILKAQLPPKPENIILLSCVRLTKATSEDPEDISEMKLIRRRIKDLLPLLNIKENAQLRQALSLIDGEIGLGLRRDLYPLLYKNCDEQCDYLSVGEILSEAKAFAIAALKGKQGIYNALFQVESASDPKDIFTKWLELIKLREEKLARGEPVDLARWYVTIGDNPYLTLSNKWPGDEHPFIISLPSHIEAFPKIVNNPEGNFTTKYVYLPDFNDSQITFYCEKSNDQSNAIKAKLDFKNSDKQLPYEIAKLEALFLQGRIPDMTPQTWKAASAKPSSLRIIPSVEEEVEEEEEATFLDGFEDDSRMDLTDELDAFDPNGKWPDASDHGITPSG